MKLLTPFRAAILLAVASPSIAQPTPGPSRNGVLSGDWTIDYKASTNLGWPFTLTAAGESAWRYDGHSAAYDMRCDGKPFNDGYTSQTCVRSGPGELDVTAQDGGRTETTRWVLAKDQRSLIVIPPYDPNAYNPAETLPETFARLSGSTGFAGTWLSTRFVHVPSIIHLSAPLPGYLLFITECKDCEGASVTFFKLSSTPVAFGPIDKLNTSTIQLLSPTRLRLLTGSTLSGRERELTLISVNGDTLIYTNRGSVAVYRRHSADIGHS